MRALAATVLAVTLGAASAQSQNAPSPPLPQFEVASIKRTTAPFQERSGIIPTPGRFVAEKIPAATLIGAAYRGEIMEMRGQPQWSTAEFYNVTAPLPPDTPAAQVTLMLRSLLIDRFKLAAHVEREEREVLALVRIDPTRMAPGLERIDVDCEAQRSTPPAPLKRDEPIPPCRATWNGTIYMSGGVPLRTFMVQLGGIVGRPVIDETGLEGNYRFVLRHAPTGPGPLERPDEYPNIYTALREQLGLKLVPKKALVNVLVVDRFERPTED